LRRRLSRVQQPDLEHEQASRTVAPPRSGWFNWSTISRAALSRYIGFCVLKLLKLFPLNAGRLDDRPPFLDLGFLKGAERLRGLPVMRKNLLAQVS
jgi:hypothetical protein